MRRFYFWGNPPQGGAPGSAGRRWTTRWTGVGGLASIPELAESSPPGFQASADFPEAFSEALAEGASLLQGATELAR